MTAPLKTKKSWRKQSYKSFKRKKERNITSIILKRYYILIGIVVLAMSILLLDLVYVQLFKNKYYMKKVEALNTRIVEGSSAPRGRIYDRNHKLLVDNVPVKTIYYKKQTGITTKEEIELAYTLAQVLEINTSSLKEQELKKFL